MIPRCSIVIPTLNEEQFLPHLLDSLVRQTVKPYEVIVVDGNSTDNTVKKAQAYKDKLSRLFVITSATASLPLQRNLGAKKATGDWIAFVDADSILVPDCLARLIPFLDTPHGAFFTTLFLPDTNRWMDRLLIEAANICLQLFRLLGRPLAPGGFAIMTKKAFEAVGGYRKEYSYGEDQDITFRLEQCGYRLSIIPERLYHQSLRRVRKKGLFDVLKNYIRANVIAFTTNKAPQSMPGYEMGGQVYKE